MGKATGMRFGNGACGSAGMNSGSAGMNSGIEYAMDGDLSDFFNRDDNFYNY